MSLATGTRLGPYEIVAPIGAGGMGEVHRARDMALSSLVRSSSVELQQIGRHDDPSMDQPRSI
jgi:serine/threonine protein kinase